jgi:stage II sporulation protein D
MRRLSLLLALTLTLACVPVASGKTLFVLTGRGWGHAVGMSQWGAYGMAKQGATYQQILAHYYRQTTIGSRAGRTIGVLLADGRTAVTIGSASSFKVAARTHAAGSATVTKTSTGRIKVQGLSGSFASPVTFSPGASPLRLGSARYRGTLVVSVRNGRLRVVNRVGLESYLRGVVPRESPSWWPAAALRAQAVAARSYALSSGGHCGGGLFCSGVSDQVYGGLDGETSTTNSAVAATAGRVVVYKGSVAQTFFSSSTGGRTASSADTWGTSLPYLQSVADPADLNADNPNRFWRVLRSARQMRSSLGLPRTPRDGTAQRNSSDRVSGLRFTGPGWVTPVEGGDSLRWRLNIRSNRFWLGVLRITPQRTRVVIGDRVSLGVLVRNLGSGKLARRPRGAVSWIHVADVSGAKSLSFKPGRSTTYRLTARGVSTTQLVKVAARINFNSKQSAGGLGGVVRPLTLAGRTVVVQRRVNGVWRQADTATVASNGSWRARFTVRAGVYRAFVTPPWSSGLVRGVSPTLTIAAS